MKDIDTWLQQSQCPSTQLPADFRRQVMEQISGSSKPPLTSKLRRIWNMKFYHKKISFAVIAVTALVIGSTASAGILWLKPHSEVDKSSVITLPNGNKRFWIHSDSCQGQSMSQPQKDYYEIKAGSSLTPDKLAQGIEAACESDLLQHLFSDALGKDKTLDNAGQKFTPYQDQFFFPYVTLKAVGSNTITVDIGLNGIKYPNVTLPLDANVRLYEKGQAIKIADLKPGRSLTLVVHTNKLDKPFSTETMQPEELNKLMQDGFPIGSTVLGAVQRMYDPELTNEMYQSMGSDWTRLEQDKNASGGWRQIAPLR